MAWFLSLSAHKPMSAGAQGFERVGDRTIG